MIVPGLYEEEVTHRLFPDVEGAQITELIFQPDGKTIAMVKVTLSDTRLRWLMGTEPLPKEATGEKI